MAFDYESSSWHSYPSILALGHKGLADLFSDPVVVQEKVDGSQLSFGLIDGELKMKSKGALLNLVAPEGMFARAVEVVRGLESKLTPNWTYRGEYLKSPKHNSLAYDRTPNQNIIIFDINTGHEEYMPYPKVGAEAARLGFEVVPQLYYGMVTDVQMFRDLLKTPSILGGQKIEGVVAKNYSRFGQDKKALMGKFVSEAFKEVHAGERKKSNPSSGDIIQNLIIKYRTPARWQKAVQHLREQGLIEDSPRDIGLLMREAGVDVLKEEGEEIREALFKYAWPKIQRGITAGLPLWYKEDVLLKLQFAE